MKKLHIREAQETPTLLIQPPHPPFYHDIKHINLNGERLSCVSPNLAV